jgi:RinA family phage transcriptional activator
LNKNSRKAQIRELENHLRHYKAYKVGIENIKQQLEWIMPSMTAQYSANEGSSGTFNISSKVEQAVLDRLESKQALDLHEEMARFQLIVDCIDRALKELEDSEHVFVVQRYFQKKSIPAVAEVLGYHEKYLQKIRNNLMEKLLISLSNILKLG